jgi:hypothetical protein
MVLILSLLLGLHLPLLAEVGAVQIQAVMLEFLVVLVVAVILMVPQGAQDRRGRVMQGVLA